MAEDAPEDERVSRGRHGTGVLKFQPTSRHSREFRTWFRGEHTNFNPTIAQLLEPDAMERFVLHGWAPPAPVIRPETQVTAFGSCFAANISEWLSARHYRVLNKDPDAKNAYVVACGEGMVNSFVIRQQFEWAWENRRFDQPLWHGYNAEDYGYDPEVQAETRAIFDATDVFILTFGLSEVWYDEPTGEVFWRTIPKDAYDPARHRFRVSSVEENKDNLRAIYRLIRTHKPGAKILFTLSPIPLIATFRDNSCITSNAVSKAVLRVAIDEVLREVAPEGHLFYWPSYELIADVFRMPFQPDRRHYRKLVLNYVMALFERAWCQLADDAPQPPLTQLLARAAAVSGLLSPRMVRPIFDRDVERLNKVCSTGSLSDDPRLDAALREFGLRLHEEWLAEDRASSAGPGG